jgi:hypothetical protein
MFHLLFSLLLFPLKLFSGLLSFSSGVTAGFFHSVFFKNNKF